MTHPMSDRPDWNPKLPDDDRDNKKLYEELRANRQRVEELETLSQSSWPSKIAELRQDLAAMEVRAIRAEEQLRTAGIGPSPAIKEILYDTYLLVTALSGGANIGVLQISEHYRERLGAILKDLS